MRLAVCGSIATDHLLTFAGRFADSVLPDQLDHLSVSFLADDLQVRRGGVGADIAYGLAVLGERPVLVGGVGADGTDYVRALAEAGVDTGGVRVSEKAATARFTCTTDTEQNQIATFYPGAMAEAAQIELAPLGEFDLVLIGADDPDAMSRHTAECRARGVAFAADPSQQLAFLDGPAIVELVQGAAWLFGNEYEAGLMREKTGWSDAQLLAEVGTLVTTLGAKGCLVRRAGEPDVTVAAVPAGGLLEPTGVGDGFRAGFLAGLAWDLPLEQCAQLGSLLATHVVESVGPQDYVFVPATALERFVQAYGEDAAALVRPHLLTT